MRYSHALRALLQSSLIVVCFLQLAASQVSSVTITAAGGGYPQGSGVAVESGAYGPASFSIQLTGNDCGNGGSWGWFHWWQQPYPCPYAVASVTNALACPIYPPNDGGDTSPYTQAMCAPSSSTNPPTTGNCTMMCSGPIVENGQWYDCPQNIDDSSGCESGSSCSVNGYTNAYETPGTYGLCYWFNTDSDNSGDPSSFSNSPTPVSTYAIADYPSSPGMSITLSTSEVQQSEQTPVQISLYGESSDSSQPLWLELSPSSCTAIGPPSYTTPLCPADVYGDFIPTGTSPCLLQTSEGSAPVSPYNSLTVTMDTQDLQPSSDETYYICGYQGPQPPDSGDTGQSQPYAPQYSVVSELTVVPCVSWLCNTLQPPQPATINTITGSLCNAYGDTNLVLVVAALVLMLLGAVIWTGASALPGVTRGTAQGYGMGMIIAGVVSGAIAGIAIWLLTFATGNSAQQIFTAGCTTTIPAPAQCQITISGTPYGGGTVNPTGVDTLQCGKSVTITATPATPGWTFGGWTCVPASAVAAGCQASPNEEITVTPSGSPVSSFTEFATFNPPQCTVATAVSPAEAQALGATTGSTQDSGVCSYSTTLSETPPTGWTFIGWTSSVSCSPNGDGCFTGSTTPYTFTTIGEYQSVTETANFQPPSCTVTSSSEPGQGGSVDPSSNTVACGTDSATFTETPTSTSGGAYTFSGWTCAPSSDSGCSSLSASDLAATSITIPTDGDVTAPVDYTLTADFTPVIYTCYVYTATSPTGSGTAAANGDGTYSGNCGGSVTLSETPPLWSTFSGWTCTDDTTDMPCQSGEGTGPGTDATPSPSFTTSYQYEEITETATFASLCNTALGSTGPITISSSETLTSDLFTSPGCDITIEGSSTVVQTNGYSIVSGGSFTLGSGAEIYTGIQSTTYDGSSSQPKLPGEGGIGSQPTGSTCWDCCSYHESTNCQSNNGYGCAGLNSSFGYATGMTGPAVQWGIGGAGGGGGGGNGDNGGPSICQAHGDSGGNGGNTNGYAADTGWPNGVGGGGTGGYGSTCSGSCDGGYGGSPADVTLDNSIINEFYCANTYCFGPTDWVAAEGPNPAIVTGSRNLVGAGGGGGGGAMACSGYYSDNRCPAAQGGNGGGGANGILIQAQTITIAGTILAQGQYGGDPETCSETNGWGQEGGGGGGGGGGAVVLSYNGLAQGSPDLVAGYSINTNGAPGGDGSGLSADDCGGGSGSGGGGGAGSGDQNSWGSAGSNGAGGGAGGSGAQLSVPWDGGVAPINVCAYAGEYPGC